MGNKFFYSFDKNEIERLMLFGFLHSYRKWIDVLTIAIIMYLSHWIAPYLWAPCIVDGSLDNPMTMISSYNNYKESQSIHI